MNRLPSFAVLAALLFCATTPDATLAADDPPPSRLIGRLPGPAGTAVAFSRDGKVILTAGGDEARVWDGRTYKPLTERLRHNAGKGLRFARVSPDGRFVLTVSGHDARLWDVATGQRASVFRHVAPVRWTEFSPDGSAVVTAGDGGAAVVWDVARGAPKTSHDGHCRRRGRGS